MGNHSDLSDSKFEEQFQNMTMDPALFTHKAHLRLAWIHLNKYGEEKAIENICNQIQKFDRRHGDGTKYHTTMTVAAVKVVEHFRSKSNTRSFQELLTENPRILTHFKELLGKHYSKDQLQMEIAKEKYVEPDILPF
jgi:hypothetical protein